MRRIIVALVFALIGVLPALAAQSPSPNLNDQAVLAADTNFQARALQSFLGYCVSIVLGENPHTVPYHLQRVAFCQSVLTNTSINYKPILATVAAANGTVVADATAGGTTPLNAGNSAAQQTLVLDTDLSNALSSAFNIFIGQP